MQPNTITEAVQEVVDEFINCGHDDITVLDLLDVLASTGYTLTKDVNGESTDAYMSSLRVSS
jgi:hypothetical protein